MRTTFIYKLLLLIAAFYLCNSGGFAQTCNPPTNAAHTVKSSTCRSNGAITVTGVAGNATGIPQYRLYNQADNVEIRQWQDANIFNDLSAATYTLHVRYSCDNGFSTVYKKVVVVGGSYIDPSITRIDVVKRAECTNGILKVTVANGSGPYTYALVESQTATEPVVSYVSAPQASNTFTGLAPGTYYVRVYDACNSYVTRSQALTAFDPPSNVLSSFIFNYAPCDKLSGRIGFTALNDYVVGTDVRSLTVTYPDGTTATLPPPTSSSSASVSFNFTMDKLGAVDASKNFPDNISNWPANFRFDYLDECGKLYTRTYTFAKPVIALKTTVSTLNTNPDVCGSNYIFEQFDTRTANMSMTMPVGAEIQIGGGAWTPITPTLYGSQSGTQSFAVPYGETVNICIRPCGENGPVYCTTYRSVAPDLRTNLAEYNKLSCTGNSGIAFQSSSSTGSVSFPVTAHLISGPAGVSIPDFTYSHLASNWATPAPTNNLPVGTYKFLFTDACGRTNEKEITLTRPLPQLNASYSYPCGSTDPLITYSNVEYYNINSSSTTSFLYAQIVNLDGTPVGSIVRTATFNTTTLTLPTSSVADGDYIIKFWRDGVDQCKYDLPWSKTGNIIQLSESMMNQNCPGTPTTSSIIATASDGVAPYRYSLYKGSYAPGNLIAPAQSSNVFNDVQGTGPFLVFAEDACGRGTQGTVSTDVSSLRVSNTAGSKMPCPNTDLTLSILNLEGATYQWSKDGAPIAGATSNDYTIAGIEQSDAGAYTVELKIGSCPVLYRGFTLDPAKCDQPLPVNLTKFTLKEVKKEGEQAVSVNWETAGELKNEGFQVMRSNNLIDWQVLGEVKGRGLNGSSVGLLKYDFTDLAPLSGVSYYQLRQIDFDGKYELSRILSINLREKFDLVMSPNPVVNKLTISGGLNKFRLAEIYNTGGVKVASKEIDTNSHVLDMSNLPSGSYIVTITDINGEKQSKNIVKH